MKVFVNDDNEMVIAVYHVRLLVTATAVAYTAEFMYFCHCTDVSTLKMEKRKQL